MPQRPTIEVRCGVQEYKICWRDEEGEAVDYDDPAFLEAGGRVFMALVGEVDDERISLLPDGEGGKPMLAVEIKPVGAFTAQYDEMGDEDEDETEEESISFVDEEDETAEEDEDETEEPETEVEDLDGESEEEYQD